MSERKMILTVSTVIEQDERGVLFIEMRAYSGTGKQSGSREPVSAEMLLDAKFDLASRIFSDIGKRALHALRDDSDGYGPTRPVAVP